MLIFNYDLILKIKNDIILKEQHNTESTWKK